MVVLQTAFLWWAASAAVTGFGMRCSTRNLVAAVADIFAADLARFGDFGIYRFWRDSRAISAFSALWSRDCVMSGGVISPALLWTQAFSWCFVFRPCLLVHSPV